MPRLIALLRGINVGGHTVKMNDLRSHFEALEFTNISTFIASGNVLFDSRARNIPKLEQQIEQHLRKALGYEVPTIIRSVPEITTAANHQAFPPEELATPGSTLYVSFLKTVPPEEVRNRVMKLCSEVDDFHFNGREIYWFCRTKMSESPLFKGDRFGKALKMPSTMRNMTTVKKLAELCAVPE